MKAKRSAKSHKQIKTPVAESMKFCKYIPDILLIAEFSMVEHLGVNKSANSHSIGKINRCRKQAV